LKVRNDQNYVTYQIRSRSWRGEAPKTSRRDVPGGGEIADHAIRAKNH